MTCDFQIPKNMDPHIVREVQAAVQRQASVSANRQMAFSRRLLLRALAGDKRAAALLNVFPFPADGATSEAIALEQNILAEAKSLHCL